MLLAVQAALGLVFDPRYKDFPFAPLTAAAVPFLLHTLTMPRPRGARGVAEMLAALLLALSVPYIVLNESLANWQSLWLVRRAARARGQSGSGARRAKLSSSRPDRERRQCDIVKHDAEAGAAERDGEQNKRWPQQVERGNAKRRPAEYRIGKTA